MNKLILCENGMFLFDFVDLFSPLKLRLFLQASNGRNHRR